MDLQYTQPKNFYQVVQELEKFNQRVGKLKEDYSKELNLDPIAMSDFRILFLNNIQGEILGYRGVLRLYIYAYENSGKNSEKLNKVLDIVLLKQITEECRDEENQKAISDYLKLNLLTSICFCIEVFFSKINKIFSLNKTKKFKPLAENVLRKLNLENKIDLFITFAAIRNSRHNNGISNYDAKTITENGLEYLIEKDKLVTCATPHHILTLLDAILHVTESILKHPDVKCSKDIPNDFCEIKEFGEEGIDAIY